SARDIPSLRQLLGELLRPARDSLPPELQAAASLADQLNAVSLSLDLTGATLVQLDLEAKDEQAAAVILDLASSAKKTLDAMYQANGKEMLALAPPDLAKSVGEVLEQTVNGISARKDGVRVVVSLKSPPGLAALSEKLVPLVPQLLARSN